MKFLFIRAHYEWRSLSFPNWKYFLCSYLVISRNAAAVVVVIVMLGCNEVCERFDRACYRLRVRDASEFHVLVSQRGNAPFTHVFRLRAFDWLRPTPPQGG